MARSRLSFGIGAVSDLHRWLPSAGEVVLLVTGHHSYAGSGAAEVIGPLLAMHRVRHFRVASRDPTIEEVEEAVSTYRGRNPGLIVAVGGGTVIDTAKLMALALGSGWAPAALLDEDTRHLPAIELVAVPTTAGSGAERTHFAVVYAGGTKHSVAAESIRPVAALVDPTLTHSMSSQLTASSGFDAFAHAMESLWSINSTPESRALSEEALGLVWDHLARAVTRPEPDVRRQMALGSTQAGAAIDITRSTAPHALAYHLTSRHGLAHGHAVSLTLGAFLEYNAGVTDDDVVDPRGAEAVGGAVETICDVLEVSDAAAGRVLVDQFARDLGLRVPETLASDASKEAWAGFVNAERMANNPRRVTDESLRRILMSVK
ncbi:MAG TPA: phosphonoacetaldehyde reductase [Acidimicrobiia bacterium]|nr:phosphonoacetaldehyde reductase [Acidimicrobiia bacterium]